MLKTTDLELKNSERQIFFIFYMWQKIKYISRAKVKYITLKCSITIVLNWSFQHIFSATCRFSLLVYFSIVQTGLELASCLIWVSFEIIGGNQSIIRKTREGMRPLGLAGAMSQRVHSRHVAPGRHLCWLSKAPVRCPLGPPGQPQKWTGSNGRAWARYQVPWASTRS